MKTSNPSLRISLAIAMLSVSVLMLADLLGFLPDQHAAIVESRATAIDGASHTVNGYVQRGQVDLISAYAERLVASNSAVQGVMVVDASGDLIAKSGQLDEQTLFSDNDSDSAVISLNSRNGPWGKVGLAFEPVIGNSVYGVLRQPLVRLALFIGLVGFVLYEFYLRRVLRYLDPTNIMPERVRTMIDALTEGVVLLDKRNRIVMSNIAFAQNLNVSIKDLPGRELSDFAWQHRDEYDKSRFPWEVVLQSGVVQEDIMLLLTVPSRGRRYYAVNATPIMDDDNRVRGALATFNDQTDIVQKNEELRGALKTLEHQREEIEQQNEELKLLATRDPLTSCLNRRAFFEIFEKEFIAARKRHMPLSCIMCDIDHFKGINDTYGHSTGDLVIKKMADVVTETVRENDHVCRYGGEEFCVILPGLSAVDAAQVAERIRANIEAHAAQTLKLTGDRIITASFGVSDLSFAASDLTELIDQSDSALYASKDNGRNCVTAFSPEQFADDDKVLEEASAV